MRRTLRRTRKRTKSQRGGVITHGKLNSEATRGLQSRINTERERVSGINRLYRNPLNYMPSQKSASYNANAWKTNYRQREKQNIHNQNARFLEERAYNAAMWNENHKAQLARAANSGGNGFLQSVGRAVRTAAGKLCCTGTRKRTANANCVPCASTSMSRRANMK